MIDTDRINNNNYSHYTLTLQYPPHSPRDR